MLSLSISNRRRIGAGFWDFVIVLVLLGGAFLAYRIFLAPKPAPVTPAPVIVLSPPPPPPPVVPAPPPAPKPQPVAIAAPPVRQTFKLAPPLPEKTPQCKIDERDLRIAQDAAAKAGTFIAAERKRCLDQVHQSPDYVAAKADLDAKKSAKDAASEKLRQDNIAGIDTDQDTKDLRNASIDWIAASAKLTTMENDALAADSALAQKQAIVASASADATRLTAKLNADVAKIITDAAANPDCEVRSIRLDTTSWIISIDLAPKHQADTAVMADDAVAQMGNILEIALCQSPFTWTKTKFSILGTYQDKLAVEFQVRYDRATVDAANFDRLHPKYFDDEAIINLGDRVWLSPVIDQLQGRSQEFLAAVKVRVGDPTDYDTLLVGGYVRSDGSKCPLVFITRPHIEPKSSSLTSLIPRKSAMPPSYSPTPMPGTVLTHPPDPMLPPD